ncbi:oxidation resistance protein 1 [Loxospora ochrophaea]|nr:oxidation resistance protein 1 [Loxospora ochrophaea]
MASATSLFAETQTSNDSSSTQSPSASGSSTPNSYSRQPNSRLTSSSSSSYLSYPVSHVVSGLYRRLTDTSHPPTSNPPTPSMAPNPISQTYTPQRTASPFQPPPLTPLTLLGIRPSTSPTAQILSRALAEEIRLLIPPRLQLVDDWSLVYSVEQDGVSLATLYSKCNEYRGKRSGFVLVVRDAAGGIFGAYLTDPPHPSPHYYGTGECFLWRASILSSHNTNMQPLLSSLPPPPSADTTHLQRSTTLVSPTSPPKNLSFPLSSSPSTGTSTPERIRFKAFPYSGVNDYMIFCEPSYLSVGGGDGRYGLWLDGVLERGVSSASLTFGNEGLSEEGEKFEVVGVEVWGVGV